MNVFNKTALVLAVLIALGQQGEAKTRIAYGCSNIVSENKNYNDSKVKFMLKSLEDELYSVIASSGAEVLSKNQDKLNSLLPLQYEGRVLTPSLNNYPTIERFFAQESDRKVVFLKELADKEGCVATIIYAKFWEDSLRKFISNKIDSLTIIVFVYYTYDDVFDNEPILIKRQDLDDSNYYAIKELIRTAILKKYEQVSSHLQGLEDCYVASESKQKKSKHLR